MKNALVVIEAAAFIGYLYYRFLDFLKWWRIQILKGLCNFATGNKRPCNDDDRLFCFVFARLNVGGLVWGVAWPMKESGRDDSLLLEGSVHIRHGLVSWNNNVLSHLLFFFISEREKRRKRRRISLFQKKKRRNWQWAGWSLVLSLPYYDRADVRIHWLMINVF